MVDLQKAADNGRNLEAEDYKQLLVSQNNALISIKKVLRSAKVDLGLRFLTLASPLICKRSDPNNELEKFDTMDPREVIKIHSHLVAEINMKIEFMKMNYESESSANIFLNFRSSVKRW